MESKFKYLKKEDRKTILLLSDDLRMHSGIATMSREFVVGTAHHFNWFHPLVEVLISITVHSSILG